MENIKLIGFDLDGTLVDSFSGSYDTDCRIIRGMGGIIPSVRDYKIALAECGTDWEAFFNKFGVKDYETALSMYYDSQQILNIRAIPGAQETLEFVLSKGTPIFLASINSRKENAMKKLKSSGLQDYFYEDYIFVDPKSKVESIIKAYKKAGIEPSETLFIGDTVVDVRDSQKAGVPSIAIANDYSFHPRDYLEREKSDYPILKDIREVLEII